jgi:hypothetical protein
MDRESYELELRKRQEEHLHNVAGGPFNWQPCMHDGCQQCHGTGVRLDGSSCIHGISCPCPKCAPFC